MTTIEQYLKTPFGFTASGLFSLFAVWMLSALYQSDINRSYDSIFDAPIVHADYSPHKVAKVEQEHPHEKVEIYKSMERDLQS